jgi:DNA modification methylase
VLFRSREVRRVLKDDGTLWVNYADTFSHSADKKNCVPRGLQARNTASWAVGLKRDWSVPPKNLLGLPWRLAFALQSDGWFLRSDIIWHKPNPMPESAKDRPTRAHEHIFLLSKRPGYFYDWEAIREPAAALAEYGGSGPAPRMQSAQALSFARQVHEPARPGQSAPQHRPERTPRPGMRGGYQGTGGIPRNRKAFRGGGAYTRGQSFDNSCTALNAVAGGVLNESYSRNKRDVWTVPTFGCPDAHFATFPPDLIEPCILAGSRPGDTVLDPFMGSGTTGMVARGKGRKWIGIELNPEYCALALKRIEVNRLMLTEIV